VICRRYAALTGGEAVLAETGESFASAAVRRADEATAPAVEAEE
jgi:hypothetical protein